MAPTRSVETEDPARSARPRSRSARPRPSAPNGSRVLVVGTDDGVRLLIRRALERDSLRVDEVRESGRARAACEQRSYELVIVDASERDGHGLDLIAQLRRASDVPVILLSERSEENDRVLGLELGADDYIVKPFFPRELAARVRSLLRRAGVPTRASVLEFGPLVIDTATREALVRGEPVDLTAREFDLLEFLASAPRQAFSRAQLLQRVWGSSTEWQQESTVTEHVRRVRRKLEVPTPRGERHQEWIATVRGFGYRFEP
ncbi:MAG TPA: response regulator transcription factor [Acidimicrobiia bacterium]|nr:response regulator transcription factor [Acidimicrobiia bacterium]